jgi:hypothetical protein
MADINAAAWPSPLAEAQARLRLRDGGLGLPSLAAFHAPAVLAATGTFYISGPRLPPTIQVLLNRDLAIGSAPPALVALVGAFRGGHHHVANKDDPLPATVADLAVYAAKKPAHLQARLSEVVHRVQRRKFEDRLQALCGDDPPDGTARTAMYKSACGKGASTIFTMLPADAHLRLGNHAFVVACALRLGLTPPSIIPSHLAGVQCCVTAGDNGRALTLHHAVSCHQHAGGGTTSRHNAIVNTLETCLRRALIPCVHEPRVVGDDYAGPDTLADFGTARYALDLTIRNPTAVNVVAAAAATPLAACARAEAEKHRHYGAAHAAAGIRFLTLAFETTGAMGEQTRVFFDAFHAHISQNVPVLPAFPETWACRSYFAYTLQRVQATLARYTSLIVHAAVSQAHYRDQAAGRHRPNPQPTHH